MKTKDELEIEKLQLEISATQLSMELTIAKFTAEILKLTDEQSVEMLQKIKDNHFVNFIKTGGVSNE